VTFIKEKRKQAAKRREEPSMASLKVMQQHLSAAVPVCRAGDRYLVTCPCCKYSTTVWEKSASWKEDIERQEKDRSHCSGCRDSAAILKEELGLL
jgi:hypothetical protein